MMRSTSGIGRLPPRQVGVDGIAQVVDVVALDPRHFVDAHVDVTRQGDVDQQQRPPVALCLHRRHLLGRQDHVRRRGGADHQVGRQQRRVQLRPRQRLPAHAGGDPLRRAPACG